MAKGTARRSFHGPLLTVASPRAVRPPRIETRQLPHAAPLEVVPPPPSTTSLGRVVIDAARSEQPSTSERERILAGVLEALQRLTRGSS